MADDDGFNPLEGVGLMVKLAVRILQGPMRYERLPPGTSRSEKVAALRPIERAAIFRSALYGVFAGGIVVLTAWLLIPYEPAAGEPWQAYVPVFVFLLLAGVIATVLEMMLIYYDTMRSSRAVAARLGISPNNLHDDSTEAALVLSLIQAGIEAPNPRGPRYGIDPRIYIPHWRLVSASVLYKLKVTATRIVARALWRRILFRLLGRSAGRASIEAVAIPVFAIWNVIVVRSVMREVRVRALGKEAVDELESYLFPLGFAALPGGVRLACLRAVRSQVTLVADFHPNVSMMLDRMIAAHGSDMVEQEQPECLLAASVHDLPADARQTVLLTFAATCALDGRIRRKHRRKFKQLLEITKRPDLAGSLNVFRDYVRDGIPLESHV